MMNTSDCLCSKQMKTICCTIETINFSVTLDRLQWRSQEFSKEGVQVFKFYRNVSKHFH